MSTRLLHQNIFEVSYLPSDIQVIRIEVNSKHHKLLAISINRPPDEKLEYFLLSISDLLGH